MIHMGKAKAEYVLSVNQTWGYVCILIYWSYKLGKPWLSSCASSASAAGGGCSRSSLVWLL